MKTALITGITGQDGSFLAELLIEKGYSVHGIIRRSSSFNTERIEHLYLREWIKDQKQDRAINLHYGDMTDSSSLIRILQQVQPDEIYNLAVLCHQLLYDWGTLERPAELQCLRSIEKLYCQYLLHIVHNPEAFCCGICSHTHMILLSL